MVTGPNSSSPKWLTGGKTPTANPASNTISDQSLLNPTNAPARIGANVGGTVDSVSGALASQNQLNANAGEIKSSQELLDRQTAVGQLIDKTYQQHKELDQKHLHQGAIGRAVESAGNGLNYHNSYNNVNKRIIQSQTDASNLVYQVPNGGEHFNEGYNKVSGFNFDPNHPFVAKDDPRLKNGWGGEIGDNAKSIKGYDKNQKAGTLAFGMFLVPGSYVSNGATTMAMEDNTRSDQTHDYSAKDYAKSLGIAAAVAATSFIPGLGEVSMASSLTGRGAAAIGESASSTVTGAITGARASESASSGAWNSTRGFVSNTWKPARPEVPPRTETPPPRTETPPPRTETPPPRTETPPPRTETPHSYDSSWMPPSWRSDPLHAPPKAWQDLNPEQYNIANKAMQDLISSPSGITTSNIRRVLFKFHPDKFPAAQQDYYTKIFQALNESTRMFN